MKRVLFGLLISLAACQRRAPQVEATQNKSQGWVIEHVSQFMSRISNRRDGHVHFSAKSLFTSPLASPQNPNEFDLAVGDSFFQPDEHSSLTLTVKEIKPSSVVLDYETSFDHRSFGKNLVTKDSGQVEIPYIK